MFLHVFLDDRKIREIKLGDQSLTIGRDGQQDLVLPDHSVSRKHASIEPHGNFYVVRDTNSTNGTFVNDHVVKLEILKQGDTIRVGKYLIRVLAFKKTRGDTSKVRIEELERAAEPQGAETANEGFRGGISAEEAALLGSPQRLRRLYEIQQRLGYVDSLSSLVNQALECVLREIEADRGCILLGDYYTKDQVENVADLEPAAVAYLKDSVILKDGEEIVIAHEFLDHIVCHQKGALTRHSESSRPLPALGAPFLSKGRTLGLVYIERTDRECPFDSDDLQFLTLIASIVSVNLTNTLLFEEVSSEREKFQAVISSLTDGVLIADADLRILDASALAAKMLRQEENPIGKSLFDLLGGFQLSMEPKLVLSEIERGGSLFQLLERGGKRRTLDVRVMPFIGAISEIRGRIVTLRDATESRRIEDLKSAFIGRIAHKLRTPLTVIEGNLPLLHAEVPGGSDGAEILDAIEKNSHTLCDLVNSFVEFMELEVQTARSLMPVGLVSPKEVVRQALRRVEQQVSAKRILVADRIPESLPKIRGDENRLVAALTNLLDNAVKFSPDGGIITLGSESVDDVLRIHITDEGPGIPPKEQETVFQVLHQVDPDKSGEVPGLGLGLAIARQIVLELGGDIQIVSPCGFPDHGLQVSVLLPAPPSSSPAGEMSDVVRATETTV